MKHFIYEIAIINRDRSGNVYQRVRVWRIVKNRIVFLGKENFSYKDDFQAAFELLETLKALPRRAFVRSPQTNCHTYGSEYDIEKHGFATIQQV